MAPASLTDTHLEDNSNIKSSYEFPFWMSGTTAAFGVSINSIYESEKNEIFVTVKHPKYIMHVCVVHLYSYEVM